MLREPKVLLLSDQQSEIHNLNHVLADYVTLSSVSDLEQCQQRLAATDYDALLCSWSFREGRWNAALDHVQEQYPDLPVIITHRCGGEKEWAEVLDAGAFDLLVAPFQKQTVLPVLEHAIATREARQYQ
jgi:DNA-binding NtrC family response regulator